MSGTVERLVFFEQAGENHISLLIEGKVDEQALAALESFVNRARKRLQNPSKDGEQQASTEA